MKLSQMKENQSGFIIDIDDDTGFNRRLFDMGFINGQNISCLNIGIFGTPIAYQIRGSKIALRKKDASRIGVVL
jgi:ferrous iron transport protein B